MEQAEKNMQRKKGADKGILCEVKIEEVSGMNYGGDAADQIVRYSMEGMEHTLRISGSIAKNLAVSS
mgnify:CR=1 FL=1